MISTLEPNAFQNCTSRSTAAWSASFGGVRMHQRLMNSSAKPESGPESSVPATGWPGMKWTPAGMWGAMSRTTAALTEPTSETVAPGLRCGPISLATAPQAPIGTQTMTRSAFFDRVRAGVDDGVGEPQFADALAASARSATSQRFRARGRARAPRARLSRRSGRRRSAPGGHRGLAKPSLPSHEFLQRTDHEPVGLLGADAQPQRVR